MTLTLRTHLKQRQKDIQTPYLLLRLPLKPPTPIYYTTAATAAATAVTAAVIKLSHIILFDESHLLMGQTREQILRN